MTEPDVLSSSPEMGSSVPQGSWRVRANFDTVMVWHDTSEFKLRIVFAGKAVSQTSRIQGPSAGLHFPTAQSVPPLLYRVPVLPNSFHQANRSVGC